MPRHALPAHLRLSLTPADGEAIVVTALPAVLGGGKAKEEAGPMWVARLDIIQGRLMAWALGGGVIYVNDNRCTEPVAVTDGDRIQVGDHTYAVRCRRRENERPPRTWASAF